MHCLHFDVCMYATKHVQVIQWTIKAPCALIPIHLLSVFTMLSGFEILGILWQLKQVISG